MLGDSVKLTELSSILGDGLCELLDYPAVSR